MKKSKKSVLIFSGVILLVLAVGILCFFLQAAPTVNHALRISELLQPVIDAKNQTINIAASADFDGRTLAMESDVYRVTEDGTSYLALEQDGNAVYVADNLLLLENGKAFRLGDTVQAQVRSYTELLPQIGALYEVLKITAEETDDRIVYSVTVAGEQVKILLEAASLWEALPAEGIRELQLQLTEKNGKLDRIVFCGSGEANAAAVQLYVTLSEFRILAAGDYPIPEAVKQSAATVNRSELFSLTEDLYRLVLALTPLADMDTISGTLELRADCGPLQLDTRMELSDLKENTNPQLDPETLQKLPEILGLMCMEGDIRCTSEGDAYLYTLTLDQASMKELIRMILPEIARYSGDLTSGMVSVWLKDGKIVTMKASVEGKVSMLFTQVPIGVCAVFSFS